MTSRPDVSFVVAAYNAEAHIAQAIRSALDSRGVDLEVIVADDGSSDGTLDVVRAFSDHRVKLLPAEQNGGPGSARNRAIAEARGRYVAVLDADDSVRPKRMERLIDRLDGADADAIVDNMRIVDGPRDGQEIYPRSFFETMPQLGPADYIAGNMFFDKTFNLGYLKPVVSLDFLRANQIAYPEDLRIGEDFLFLLQVLASGSVCLTESEPGYDYRISPDSISRVLRVEHLDSIIAGDHHFAARFTLSPKARERFRQRRRSLERARAFLVSVEALKTRRYGVALRSTLRHPSSARHFWMPIAVRLKRFRTAVFTQT